MNRRSIAASVLVSMGTIMTGCADAIPYYLSQEKKDKHNYNEDPKPYCSRLALASDHAAQLELSFGIVLSILAGGAILTGAAIGPGADLDPSVPARDNANWAEKNRNSLILGAGGLLAVPAAILLLRSKDASKASGAAALALAETDSQEQYAACLNARSVLATDREALADYAKSDLDVRIKTLSTLQKDAETNQNALNILNDPNASAEAKSAAKTIINNIAIRSPILFNQLQETPQAPAKQ